MTTDQKRHSDDGSDTKERLWYIFILLLAVGFVLAFARVWFGFLPDSKITINDQHVDVTVADTSTERARGLGGRERLGDREGMLFTFSSADEYCIWMKDMNFSIDVLWLDSDKTVVDINEDISPETYPQSFCPSKPSQYILEIGAGKAAEWQIEVGNQAEF